MSPARAGDATAPAETRVPRGYIGPAGPPGTLCPLYPELERPRPKPAGQYEHCHDAFLQGVPASEERRRAQAVGRVLTVGPAQSSEEQIALQADSRHGESGPLRLRGELAGAWRPRCVGPGPFRRAVLNSASLLPKAPPLFSHLKAGKLPPLTSVNLVSLGE